MSIIGCMSGSSFGAAASHEVDLAAPALRQGAVDRLKAAGRALKHLHDSAHEWWRENEPAFEVRLGPTKTEVEVVQSGVHGPLPIKDWELDAVMVVERLREALDNLAVSIARAHVGPKGDAHVQFPTYAHANEWRSRKNTRALPAEAWERMHDIQPFATGREDLTYIQKLSNDRKHNFTVSSSIILTELEVRGGATLEGPVDPQNPPRPTSRIPDESVDKNGNVVLSPHEQVIVVQDWGQQVHSTERPEMKYTFAPFLLFKGEEIPMLRALHDMFVNTEWAIAYVTKQHDSASAAPADGDFGLYYRAP